MVTNAKLILMYNELCAVIYIPLRFQKNERKSGDRNIRNYNMIKLN